jgi:hypothetical protein
MSRALDCDLLSRRQRAFKGPSIDADPSKWTFPVEGGVEVVEEHKTMSFF